MLIHIVPGWSEDKWHINRFKATLPADLILTDNPATADIILAHSSGCYSLPRQTKARLTVLIGPPYGNDTPLFIRIFGSIVKDIPRQLSEWGILYWFNLRAHNTFYAIIHPTRHIKIWRSIRRTLSIAQSSPKTLLIRNRDDKYCSPQINKYIRGKALKYIELDGLHEDCWRRPKLYIDLLLKEL